MSKSTGAEAGAGRVEANGSWRNRPDDLLTGAQPPRPQVVSAVLAATAFLGGALSLLGWVIDVPSLTDWFGTGISIQPNTSLSVAIIGAALLALTLGHRRWGAGLGILAALMGAVTLLQYGIGDLGIDLLLRFDRPWGTRGTTPLGRMGLPGALSLCLLGLGIALACAKGRARRLVPVPGLVVALITLFSLNGYLFAAQPLNATWLSAIALQTSAMLFAASLGLIAAVSEYEPARTFFEDSAAGVLARRTLPFVVVIPPLLGYVRTRGERAGFYDPGTGRALLVVALKTVLVAVLWAAVLSVKRRDERRRAAEEAKQGTDRLLAETLENISDGFVTIDSQWRYTFVNAEASRLLKRSPRELLGRSVWDRFPEELGGAAHVALLRGLEQNVSVEFEEFSAGLGRWFSGRAHPTGHGGLAVYFQDITARKETQAALMSREQQLQHVTDNAAVMVVQCSRDLKYVFVNKTTAEFFGRTVDEIIGRPIVEVIGADALEAIRPHVEMVLRGERVEYEGVVPYARRGPRWMRGVYVPDRNVQGDVVGWIGAIADLTEHKRMVEALRESEEALRESDRRKDRFLATLAHELRNPLSPIRYSIAMLKMKGTEDAKALAAYDVIDRQVSSMARLLDELLDINKLGRDNLQILRENVALEAVIANAIETMRPLIESRRHEIEVVLPGAPVKLDADPVRLAQVFGNLLNNAAKYMDPGGRIKLTADVESGSVVVRVKDNGIGIAPESLPHLFEMFSQVPVARERAQGGIGIGLSLAKGLVELHGGTIEAHSEGVGKGAEFLVRLPIATGASVPAADPTPRFRPGAKGGRRILIADDLKDNADSLAIMLRSIGHEVHVVNDGESAVAAALELQPEIMLLDIGMPYLNGYEACRRIRQQPRGRSIFLIAQTGWGQDDDKRRAEEAGFDHHLLKPVDGDALLALLASRSEN